MIDAGFNLVSLATNHTIDRGEKAALNSRTYWNNQKDVLAVGSYSSFEERDKVVIKEKNNITYTMLNYTYGTNGIPVPKGKEYLVNVWPAVTGAPESNTEYINYKDTVYLELGSVDYWLDSKRKYRKDIPDNYTGDIYRKTKTNEYLLIRC